MDRQKLIKKGKKLQRQVNFMNRLNQPKTTGIERSVDTSHGKIRVLEYGFDDAEIRPLFVDLHGGGFILLNADFDEPMNLFLQEKHILMIKLVRI